MSRWCELPQGFCEGKCCALPGDTIVWYLNQNECSTLTATYIPAIEEDLIERGFIVPGKSIGELCQYAKLARDDPSQLEDDGDKRKSSSSQHDDASDNETKSYDGDASDETEPPKKRSKGE